MASGQLATFRIGSYGLWHIVHVMWEHDKIFPLRGVANIAVCSGFVTALREDTNKNLNKSSEDRPLKFIFSTGKEIKTLGGNKSCIVL